MYCDIAKKRWSFISAMFFIFVLIAAGMYNQFFMARLLDFDYQRDGSELVETFNQDKYWLMEGTYIDLEHLMQTHSPTTHEPQYYGKLFIKVLRDHGKLAGFVTYHLINSYDGRVQFLSVNQKFRGKGYGKLLLSHAVQQLFNMGCLRVILVTRTSNIWAQRIYTTLGFKETHRDGGFVDYAIQKGSLKS